MEPWQSLANCLGASPFCFHAYPWHALEILPTEEAESPSALSLTISPRQTPLLIQKGIKGWSPVSGAGHGAVRPPSRTPSA